MEISPDKVAIYIRWSSEDQGEGTTLEVQSEGCRHYLLSQGWRVRDDLIFIDDGYSGASLERPGLTRLRELVKVGEVECVVVYKLDRLSRSVADTARLVMDEWEGICYVKSAREPIETTSQAGKMFFYTLMNYAEWERSVIRDRTHSGRVRRAQEGKNPGITVPYGYQWDGERCAFEVVPHEAAVVKRIFEAYRLGAGLLTIANGLNREGTPFRGGRKWQVNTVSYMLSNRAYTGELVWGVRTRNQRYGKRPGEKAVLHREQPLVRRAGVFPVIIPEDEFDLVQAIKRERPRIGRSGGGSPPGAGGVSGASSDGGDLGPGAATPAGGGRSMGSGYLLTGLLRCALCGRPMVGQYNDPRRKNGYYYSCITRRDKGKAVCPAGSIQCHLLDREVTEKLLSLYGTEEAKARSVASLRRDTEEKVASARSELAEVDRRLARIEERDQRICRDYTSELLSIGEFRDLRTALQAERTALKAARESLAVRITSYEALLRERGHLKELIDRLSAWDELPVPQRKQLLRMFVTRVTAVRDESGVRCQLVWRVDTNLVESASAD